MNTYIREPINGLTHLFGAMISVVGLFLLIMKTSAMSSSSVERFAVIVFGVSMILLYSASAIYHMIMANERIIKTFRRIDHAMIFVLIAGTYTPISLIGLSGTKGWILFTIIHSLALLGVLYKLIWFDAPRWLSTAIYIIMGWLIIFYSGSLAPMIGTKGMLLLVLGGVIYTIGGLIYWFKPKWLEFQYMGYHEIFHLFIMGGSFLHFLCIYNYVV
ncbi:hemolysin III [Cerasibacillus quisquiliarum]|uniref:Hemolysin III n=1 Tax=Cerasibacillus quisquiliarum TaxID=227865 RepID=A0A511UTB5_9BACI|nr:hemolysin III family protein [Cerasibacillus quisquiliarum]MBB5145260.1 hemolysin III [Cerasibacillus quisquiliarum]GEN29850.1 hemolysin III [Cerasibacillus quisquiliarum]